MHIQFGGGIRSLSDAEGALAFGADRIILGTAAQQQPELVQAAIERFGANAIVVALDARDGLVATHGWQQTLDVTAVDAATRMSELGVMRILFTDVGRDGMLSGVNVAATAALAEQSGLGVIASGGVAGLSDVVALARCAPSGIENDTAAPEIYTGALHLEEVMEAVRLLYGSGIGQAETGEA
jgi:phosphoribosylformimino-5-aminoimidazole carboxamide ribotide isomerase